MVIQRGVVQSPHAMFHVARLAVSAQNACTGQLQSSKRTIPEYLKAGTQFVASSMPDASLVGSLAGV